MSALAQRCSFVCRLILIGLLSGLCGCRPRTALVETRHQQFVVGLSPFLDEQAGEVVYRHLVRFLLEEMPLNASLWIYDAYHLKTVALVEVPNQRAFQSGRTRANQFSSAVQSLRAFLLEPHDRPVVEGLSFNGAIKLPQFMEFVGENLMNTNATVTALVLGSPLYQDDKEPGFSMRNDYFPSDGHLLATRDRTVFGRWENPNGLRPLRVHLGYFGDPWISEIHRRKIGRFWALYLRNQGASLVSLSNDLPTIFQSLAGGAPGSEALFSSTEIDASAAKIEMLRVTREVPITDWITRELPSNHRPPPPSTTVGPMKIGIRWQGAVDLDLYARPDRNGAVLFFDQKEIREGYYYKDHRSSPDREYEFIEFTEPVDLTRVRAGVNFYEGRSQSGITGEVRVEFEGRIYSGEFKIQAEHGNQGRSGSGQEPFWVNIDVPGLMGLDP